MALMLLILLITRALTQLHQNYFIVILLLALILKGSSRWRSGCLSAAWRSVFVTVRSASPLIGRTRWPRDSLPWAPHFRSSDVLCGSLDGAEPLPDTQTAWKSPHCTHYCCTINNNNNNNNNYKVVTLSL